MFEVYKKSTLTKFQVYGINNDKNGYPHFLIRKDGQWLWRSAKEFITVEEYWTTVEKGKMLSDGELKNCPKVRENGSPRCMYLKNKIWCTRKECAFN